VRCHTALNNSGGGRKIIAPDNAQDQRHLGAPPEVRLHEAHNHNKHEQGEEKWR
jgi:hypothetical protein